MRPARPTTSYVPGSPPGSQHSHVGWRRAPDAADPYRPVDIDLFRRPSRKDQKKRSQRYGANTHAFILGPGTRVNRRAVSSDRALTSASAKLLQCCAKTHERRLRPASCASSRKVKLRRGCCLVNGTRVRAAPPSSRSAPRFRTSSAERPRRPLPRPGPRSPRRVPARPWRAIKARRPALQFNFTTKAGFPTNGSRIAAMSLAKAACYWDAMRGGTYPTIHFG
jgi:hypothetical protein